MQLSAPKETTFWVAVVIALIGLVAGLVPIPVLSGFALWVVLLAFVLLAAANWMEGL